MRHHESFLLRQARSEMAERERKAVLFRALRESKRQGRPSLGLRLLRLLLGTKP